MLHTVLFVLLSSPFLFGNPETGAAGLAGEVTDPQGLVIANAQVRLLAGIENGSGGAELREAATDNLGRFQFRQLRPGVYRLKACATGFECGESSVEVRDASAEPVEIRLRVAGIYEGVVVTASRQESETSETTLASAVVPSQRLEEQITLNMAQALEAVPGVNWENAGAFRSRPVVRGLDSNRVLILVDGERLNNGRTSTTNTGIEPALVDLSQIDQVEVVNGPGSVLYGSDALGGVINIRTRTARPGDTLRLGARVRGEWFTNSNGQRSFLDLTGSQRWWSLRAAGSVGNINDYRSPAGPLYFSGVDEKSALTDLRFYPASGHSFFAKFSQRNAHNFGVPSLESYPVFLAVFPFSKLQKFSGGYNGSFRSPWVSILQVRAYRQEQPRDFYTDLTAAPDSHIVSDTVTRVRSMGVDAQITAIAAKRHQLTYGISSYGDRHRENRLQVLRTGIDSTVLTRAPSVPNSTFANTGLFVQDQLHLSRRLRLQGGIRVDHYRLNASKTAEYDAAAFTVIEESRRDTAWSGNLGAGLAVGSHWTATANLGRAFREPNLFERYFFGRGSLGNFFVPNPNLKPETSLQLDLGARMDRGPVRASINYFLNNLRDLITTVPGTFQGQTARRGEPIRQNVNINRARIQGVESTGELSFKGARSQWTTGVTAVWQRGTNRTTDLPLGLIAPFVGQARLRFAPRGTRIWSEWQTRVTKGGNRVPPGEIPITGYTSLAWRWGTKLTRAEWLSRAILPPGVSSIDLQFGIENVANRLYRGLFETVPQPGREFRFAVDFNLDAER